MLDPRDRRLLFEAFEPPEGYGLDCAVGTTFSLDLLAMVTVPLTFAQMDMHDGEGRLRLDPLALLKAMRDHMDRIHVFCQAGQIAVPQHFRGLFAFLEPAVHPVVAPAEDGVFHPKVWVLRFADPQGAICYRLLVLSRNLTFDRSWDTMLVLEERLTDRRNAFARNHPLGDFVRELPLMCVTPPAGRVLTDIDRIQSELRRVEFDVPEGMDRDSLTFWPLGLKPHHRVWPFAGRISRLLAVSPFVSAGILDRFGPESVHLVSRMEELATLDASIVDRLATVRVLHDAAAHEPAEPPEQDSGETVANGEPRAESLNGLHAKLYVADAGWDARVWTGSANATDAAFSRNVEFLVELRGRRSQCGIDAVLGAGGFAGLLQPFLPPDEPGAPDPVQRELERAVEEVRRLLARTPLVARVEPAGTAGEYALQLEAPEPVRLPAGLDVRCWPITLKEELAAVVVEPGSRVLAAFGPLSIEALSGFIAFHVSGAQAGREAAVRFVLSARLDGAPADRPQAILRSLLRSRQQVLRYLLMLLSAGGSLAGLADPGGGEGAGGAGSASGPGGPAMPVLEALVRALHRNPAQLDQVERLVRDLSATPEGRELLPEGFAAVWAPIWAARQGVQA